MSANLRVEMIYYTYAYLREDKTPYYIGKGKGNRAYRRSKTDIKPPKDKSRILILKKNLTEEEAFKHEIYMIAVFGRKDLGTGILHNKTNGGDGFSGFVPSEETRKKLSEANKGRTFSQEHKEKLSIIRKGINLSEDTRRKIGESGRGRTPWNKGKTLSEETKRKISEAHTGKSLSEETKRKISEMNKGRSKPPLSEDTRRKISEANKGRKYTIINKPQYEITFNNNEKIIIYGKLEWCLHNGYNSSSLYKVQTKKWKKYKNIISVIKLDTAVPLVTLAH